MSQSCDYVTLWTLSDSSSPRHNDTNSTMSTRGRSPSPRRVPDVDVDMENGAPEKNDAKVVVVNHLTRNVVEAHLRTIFGFYGKITKVDLPVYGKCLSNSYQQWSGLVADPPFSAAGQNRGKAALEFEESAAAHKAASHMNGGQLDGAVLNIELSDLPVRSRSRSPRPRARNGRDKPRSLSRSRSRDPQNPPPRRDGGVPRFPAPSVQEAIKKLSHVLRDRTKNFRLKDYLEPEELISGRIWEEEEEALVDCVRDRLDDGDGEDGIWRVERKERQLRKQAQRELAKREGREWLSRLPS